MSAAIIVSASMLVISLILAGAMILAWGSFGRPRHALSWSIAYLLYSGEIVSEVAGSVFPFTDPIMWRLGLICILMATTLVVVGARQRVGLPSQGNILSVAAAATWIGAQIVDLLAYDIFFVDVSGSAFAACVLPLAIRAVLPRHRRPDPAEWAAMVSLALFASFELLLVAARLSTYAYPDISLYRSLYAWLYLVGLMPVFVANGIAAILLLTYDLAARLRALASNDPLTGVLNRRGFHDAATRAVANGRRYRQAVSVVIVDIDHFKSINDRFGHTAGDRTLHFICSELANSLRGGDIVGRIGGEEFALLLVNSAAEQAAEAMERIRAEIATGFSADGAPIPVTASFGVAAVHFAPGHADKLLSDALDRADRALYQSKIGGRNRITVAD